MLYKYQSNTFTKLDSSAVLYYDLYKHKASNELFALALNASNNKIFKINSSAIITSTISTSTQIGRAFGKVGNKLLCTSNSDNIGIDLVDLTTGVVADLYAPSSTTQPAGFTSINDVAQTLSGNTYYIKCLDNNLPNGNQDKIWVTDGTIIIPADMNVFSASNLYARTIGKNYCSENMISVDYVSFNNVGLITTLPNGTASKQCVQSAITTLTCITNTQYTTLNTTYVTSSDNLYKITNCATQIGVNELENNNSFSIYPNPTTGILNVRLEMLNEPTSLTITNILGEVVLTETILTQNSQLKTENLNSGIYVLQIGNSNAVKFIKE